MTDYLTTDYSELAKVKIKQSNRLSIGKKVKKLNKLKTATFFEKLIPSNTKMTYPQFLKTRYWKTLSKHIKELAGNKCGRCGTKANLHIHHKKYPARFTEHKYQKYLECLCKKCHVLEHDILPDKMGDELKELNNKFYGRIE